ncbi:MAG: CapA family protein [Lachnospiraceae bacterium]|nr:CapA family protein [Lachnospiraceae bacterium]
MSSKSQPADSTSLVFTGDIGFDKYMDGRWKDEKLLSSEIRAFLRSADNIIANVEGPLGHPGQFSATSGTEQLKHTMSEEVADFLDSIGVDIWNLCNNHIMDAGPEGLENTLRIAREHGVRTIGVGMNITDAKEPVIIRKAGGIGMIGVGYQRACRAASDTKGGCFPWNDMTAISEQISKIKKECRWCVIVSHAGEEFTALPSPYTRERYLEYLRMGADVVVCHHPHVPMNYELVGDKAIFYSLGNFIFDTDYQRSQFNTEKGILLKLMFTEDSFTFEAMGLRIVRGPETIEKATLPDIFEDIREDEFKLLSPLSVKMFIAATKRQLRYLKPDEFKDATEEKWMSNFTEPLRSGRVPGETLDLPILLPIAAEAEKGDWKKSKHKKVVDYILAQM